MYSSIIFLVIFIFGATQGAEKTQKAVRNYCGELFQCSNGECINPKLLCNRRNDCSDGSDEQVSLCFFDKSRATRPPTNTRRPTTTENPAEIITNRFRCPIGDFVCLSGECIKQSRTCDGRTDCRDGSDESRSICPDLWSGVSLSHADSGNTETTDVPSYVQPTVGINSRNENNYNTNDNKNNNNNNNNNGNNNNKNNNVNNNANNYGNNGEIISASSLGHDRLQGRLTPCEVPRQPSHGHWKLHRSLCDSGLDCSAPSYTRTMEPGTYLVYSCDVGYVLKGNRDVLCGPGGQWIREPTCEEIKCKYLSDSATEAICLWNNVAVSCEIPVPVTTVASLRCRDGFVQEVSYTSTFKNVTCQADGTWSPNPIKCVKKPRKVKLVLEGDMILED